MKTIPHCLNSCSKEYSILGDLKVILTIAENPYDIPPDVLFGLAARRNKKRLFLFVSKLLGKHIPVFPEIPQIGGALLADLFYHHIEGRPKGNIPFLIKSLHKRELAKEAVKQRAGIKQPLSKPTLFIGFAETATGLGHAMYSAFSENAGFIHTTRDEIAEMESVFRFDEEHSHAVSHLCYARKEDFFDNFQRIVLVDDEITTGKTALNLIEALNQVVPNREYVVASILDWRTREDHRAFKEAEERLGVDIKTLSLLKGTVWCNNAAVSLDEPVQYTTNSNRVCVRTVKLPSEEKYIYTLRDTLGNQHKALYLKMTGRFGIYCTQNKEFQEQLKYYGEVLSSYREYERCLCMGNGEFIYIPSVISQSMGEGVMYQSTTRSPIYACNAPHYPIKNAVMFQNPEDVSIANYIYNVLPGQYDEVFWFLERDINEPAKKMISDKLGRLGVRSLCFVVFE
ncbi:MAG: hypothetical protein GX066_10250 [Clostridiaceae bacterium]|nr:hypothetical protein [Clostridiaceae bacterium]